MTCLFWFPEGLPVSTPVAPVALPQTTQDYLPLTYSHPQMWVRFVMFGFAIQSSTVTCSGDSEWNGWGCYSNTGHTAHLSHP